MVKFMRFFMALLFWLLLIAGIAAIVLGCVMPNLFNDLKVVYLGTVLTGGALMISLGVTCIMSALIAILPFYCFAVMACEMKAIKRQLANLPQKMQNNSNAQTNTNGNGVGYHVIKLD